MADEGSSNSAAPAESDATKINGQAMEASCTSRGSSSDRASPVSVGSNGQSTTKVTALSEKRQLREERRIEQIMSALSNLTVEEQLHTLCKKHAALLEENLVMQKTMKETQKMYAQVVKEKEEAAADTQKLLLTKLKLETLCRELQRQNKEIKAEHLERMKEDEKTRKQLSAQVQGSLDEIHQQMAGGKERSDRLAAENIALGKKIDALTEQCVAREDHTKKLAATHDIEKQLYDAKLQAALLQVEKVKEEKLKVEHDLLLTLQKRDTQLKETMETEALLREQMQNYTNKYDELHSSLADSNITFQTFKREMDQVNSNLVKLEKESRQWKKKYEESNSALLVEAATMAELKHNNEQLHQKFAKLEQICRALQEDRAKLRQMISAGGQSGDDRSADVNGNGDDGQQEQPEGGGGEPDQLLGGTASCVAAT